MLSLDTTTPARADRRARNARAGFIAGALASLALLLDEKSRRFTLALYISTRTTEFAYVYLMRRGYLPNLPHGDALVMAISSAQIINALVMEPDTLEARLDESARAWRVRRAGSWAHQRGQTNRLGRSGDARHTVALVLLVPAGPRRLCQVRKAVGAVSENAPRAGPASQGGPDALQGHPQGRRRRCPERDLG